MKKNNKIIKVLVSIFVFCIMLWITNALFRFILIDDTNSYTRIALHEMYEEENIDVLFLGSSHVYRALDPYILDEMWGVNTFNMGSSSQQPITSYYLLKEVINHHEVSKVYVEMFYDLLWGNQDYESPTSIYIISDYMKMSLNKMDYIWSTGKEDYLVHGLILGRRNWDKLFDLKYQKELFKKKMSQNYLSYAYVKGIEEEYKGKGFVYRENEIEEGTFYTTNEFHKILDEPITEKNKYYYEQIINICKKNNIELVFYSAPMSDFRLCGVGNYDAYITEVEAFLEDKDISYYDFNLVKSEYLNLQDNDFADEHHLNGKGAEKFTYLLGKFFCDGYNLGKECFWNSYQQKMNNEEQRCFGLICTTNFENGYIYGKITPVQNSKSELYYAVYERKEDEKEYTLIKDYSVEKKFIINTNQKHGYYKVYAATDEEGVDVCNIGHGHY